MAQSMGVRRVLSGRKQRQNVPAEARPGVAWAVNSYDGTGAIAAIHPANAVLSNTHYALLSLNADKREEPVFRRGVIHARGFQIMVLGCDKHIESIGSFDISKLRQDPARNRRLQEGRLSRIRNNKRPGFSVWPHERETSKHSPPCHLVIG
ncbi:MAG: hypothetical protein ACLPPF_13410 [Rhodomicrobium sp.]